MENLYTKIKKNNKEDIVSITSTAELFENYELFNNSDIEPIDLTVFMENQFYPVKEIKTKRMFFISPIEDIKSKLIKSEDKSGLHLLKKFGTRNFIYVPFDIFNNLFTVNTSIIDKEYSQGEAKAFFQDLLTDANRKKASDIHLTWAQSSIIIKYRIDGKMIKQDKTISLELGKALRNIFVNKSGESEYEEREVAGQITEIIDGKKMEYRLSIGPTIYGYVIVIRAESHIGMSSKLEDWGYSPLACSMIRRLFSSHHGIILVTGATGSGKSTLLYTNIIEKMTENEKYSPEILTVEDPVEIALEGVNQVQVNTKGKKENWITFSSAIKMFLRQDPDMIVVGEIRDYDVAMQAVTAAKTGHLTASTMHTNDVKSSFTRLNELGIDNSNIEDGVKGVISQKLINKLCTKCKQEEIIEGYKYYSRNPNGCEYCKDSSVLGYKGRVPIVEIAELNNRSENYRPENFEDYYSIESNILYLLEEGIIDLEEARKYIKIDHDGNFNERKLCLKTWNIINQDKRYDLLYPTYQPIVDKRDYIIGYDVFLRIKDETGAMIDTRSFIEIMKEMNTFEKVFIFFFKELSKMVKTIGDKSFFLKIDKETALSDDFQEMLLIEIKKNRRIFQKIIFKTTFSYELEDFYLLCNSNNIQIALEDFTPNTSDIIFIERHGINFKYIQTIKDFVQGIKNEEKWLDDYIRQLESLDSRIIATFIETQGMLKDLRNIFGENIYGYQGYGIQFPSDQLSVDKYSIESKG